MQIVIKSKHKNHIHMKNIKYFLIIIALLSGFSVSNAQNSVTISTVSGGTPGTALVVPVNAQLTTVTSSIQFTVTYDPTVLQYVSLSNYYAGMPMFYSSSNPSAGTIIFSYLDFLNFTTFSIPTVSKLFDINFTCIDYASGTSNIQFSGSPISIEFLDENFEEFFPTMTNGGIGTSAPPATSTYSGTGTWNVFGNWDNGLPGTTTNAFIANGAVNTISTAAKCNNLTINGGGALTLSTGKTLTIGGAFTIESGGSFIDLAGNSRTATVKRAISGNWAGEPTPPDNNTIWHYVSSPVSGATINTFLNCLMNSWDEPGNAWIPLTVPTGTPMTIGTGYAVAAKSSYGTATFTGTLNNGDLGSYNLARTAANSYAGWNLVGNPFPSAVNFASLTRSNVDGGAYLWDGAAKNYVVYVTGSYSDPFGYGTFNGVIPAEQAFFVHVTSSNLGLIGFPNVARTHGSGYYKEAPGETLLISASGNGLGDKTMVAFRSEATTDFDPEFDGYKLSGSYDAPQLYTIGAETNLSINTLPDVGVHPVIPMGYTVGVAGENTITVAGLESFSPGTSLYIEDLLANKTQDLNANPVYTFTAAPGQQEHRFNLHFSPVGVKEINGSNIRIYSSEQTIFVNIPDALHGDIVVYNIMGTELLRKAISGSSLNKITLDLTTGYYIVKVLGDSQTASGKVFIR
jgi:hypothetical protein